MATERLANLGYFGLVKQSGPTTIATPTDFIPLYDESLSTAMNFVDQKPIYGTKFATFGTLQGTRSHKGDVTLLAEPNTTARLFDMLLTKQSSTTTYTFTVTSANATVGATYTNNGATFTVTATIASQTTLVCTATSGTPSASGTLTKASGTGDATITYSVVVTGPTSHAFGLSTTTNPNSYTVDISTGNVVSRYWGVQASKITPAWNSTELQWKLSVSALGSFQGREIATVSGTTITLKTDYDPSPNTGLVASDLVRVYKMSDGSTLDTTVSSVNVDGITVVLGNSAAAFAAGDMIYLRPATVTYTLQPTLIWPKTQFQFATTASAALSATQTRIEQGSTFELIHNFESDGGSPRSGAFDPASLVRKLGDANFTVKKFFDTPDDIKTMNNLATTAAVIRHLSGSTNQYEVRVTFNQLKTDGTIVPDIKSDNIAYSEFKYHTNYNQSDSQAYAVLVTNNLVTI